MKFAKRMERMQASEIRELLKLTAQPDIISFAGGLPAPELFPVEEIAKVSHDLVEKEGRALLQYATTEGRPTLRAKIAKRMKDKYHTEVNPDDILITTGSQQCLDFAGKLFLDPGDVVLCESPSYLGALNAFNAYEPNFVEVPTDDGGLIPEELDKILEIRTSRTRPAVPGAWNAAKRLWKLSTNITCRYWKITRTANCVMKAKFFLPSNPSIPKALLCSSAPSPKSSARACV